MSIYEKMIQSLELSTPDPYFDLLHPDYVFVRHQSGEEVSKKIGYLLSQVCLML